MTPFIHQGRSIHFREHGRGVEYSIAGFAAALWSLLDHLGIERLNIVGFSMGGAVAMEMSLQRPDRVERLGLINSLATYRLDHWSKWLEARIPALLVPLIGMKRMARFAAGHNGPRSTGWIDLSARSC